jgi:hypothetical protein
MMTPEEAKTILAVGRAGGSNAEEARLREAIELSQNDPELAAWYRREQSFDAVVSQALKAVPMPTGLLPSILAGTKVIEHLAWWQLVNWRRVAACALVFLTGAGLFLFSFNRTRSLLACSREAIEMAEARTAGLAVKEGDLTKVRAFFAQCRAPADFDVPGHLRKLEVMGCTLVAVQDQTAAVIRFRIAGDAQLTLFVLDRADDHDLPDATSPRIDKQGEWSLALWTDGKRTYVLAGKVPRESLRRIAT